MQIYKNQTHENQILPSLKTLMDDESLSRILLWSHRKTIKTTLKLKIDKGLQPCRGKLNKHKDDQNSSCNFQPEREQNKLSTVPIFPLDGEPVYDECQQNK